MSTYVSPSYAVVGVCERLFEVRFGSSDILWPAKQPMRLRCFWGVEMESFQMSICSRSKSRAFFRFDLERTLTTNYLLATFAILPSMHLSTIGTCVWLVVVGTLKTCQPWEHISGLNNLRPRGAKSHRCWRHIWHSCRTQRKKDRKKCRGSH